MRCALSTVHVRASAISGAVAPASASSVAAVVVKIELAGVHPVRVLAPVFIEISPGVDVD